VVIKYKENSYLIYYFSLHCTFLIDSSLPHFVIFQTAAALVILPIQNSITYEIPHTILHLTTCLQRSLLILFTRDISQLKFQCCSVFRCFCRRLASFSYLFIMNCSDNFASHVSA